ncbi:MAG: helix-hairpin-helix domain-containing protein [Bacteroidota bacterium]|nr:helix-hairpin-helix domain-containing protein [Bacteroidota bacterium]
MKIRYTRHFQYHFAVIIILAISGTVFSQEQPLHIPEDEVEQILNNTENPPDLTVLMEEQEELLLHPINLNRASEEDLQKISFLTLRQIRSILTYIVKTGTVYSIHELQSIEGLDSITVSRLMPYVCAGMAEENHSMKFRNILSEGQSQLILRFQQTLQQQKGYKSSESGTSDSVSPVYQGSPQGYYFRYRYHFTDRFQAGISGKKDPGEQFFRKNQRQGMDIYSAYINLKDFGFLKNIILGNFQADFGQCLTLGTGRMMNTSLGSSDIIRPGGGFRPSLSTSSSGSMKGIASTFRLGKFDISAFYSKRKRDATVRERDPETNRVISVTSFQETSYHRSEKEIEKRNTVVEQITGGNIRYRHTFFSIGMTAFHSQWDVRIAPLEHMYNKYSFRGNSNINAGADFKVRFSDHYGFGEFSISQNGGKAWLIGVQINPEDEILFLLAVRNYDRDFQNFFAHGFGRNSQSANEQGIFFSVRSRPANGIELSGFVDACRFPWLKYRVDFPSSATECGLISDIRVKQDFLLNIQCRYRYSEINGTFPEEKMHRPVGQNHLSIRFKTNIVISPSLQIGNRIDWVRNRSESSGKRNGISFLQDIQWKSAGKPVNVSFRYALFDSDSYEERICTYERDVLYGYSSPFLDGKGIRCYLLISWTPFHGLTIWGKAGNSWYSDRTVTGSGDDEINGPQKTEVRLQAQFKW